MFLLGHWNHNVKVGQARLFTGQGVCRLLCKALPQTPALSTMAPSACKVNQATVVLASQCNGYFFSILCLQSQLGNSYAGFEVCCVLHFFHLGLTEHRKCYWKRMEKTDWGYKYGFEIREFWDGNLKVKLRT